MTRYRSWHTALEAIAGGDGWRDRRRFSDGPGAGCDRANAAPLRRIAVHIATQEPDAMRYMFLRAYSDATKAGHHDEADMWLGFLRDADAWLATPNHDPWEEVPSAEPDATLPSMESHYSVAEFAALRGMSVRAVQQSIKRGSLPAERVTAGGRVAMYLIPKAVGDAWNPRPVGRPRKDVER